MKEYIIFDGNSGILGEKNRTLVCRRFNLRPSDNWFGRPATELWEICGRLVIEINPYHSGPSILMGLKLSIMFISKGFSQIKLLLDGILNNIWLVRVIILNPLGNKFLMQDL